MQVSITQLANGTTADATAVDANFNNIANVLNGNIDATNLAGGTIGASAYADGWTPLIGITPTSVTYNGNRSYNLVFNGVNLTTQISNGMRLKGTRTVTAPTQCTSLNGTTQFYSKTTPNGMTFTNNFVVSAWVKLAAYTSNGTIASRYNGTSGWRLQINGSGQVSMDGFNAGAANFLELVSYQSIPLNKWVHVAAQMDMTSTTTTGGTANYIMIDGVEVPSLAQRGGTSPTSLVQAGNLEIGSNNGGTALLNGKIAQVAIYSAKVAESAIQATISQGLAGTETSLISAYSFNNSINDLNANANNLTANGSAVATNTDSPFTQDDTGTPLGTTDFGIVTSKVFSTNTTLTVQVPEGCAIPTSGGVSAISYSTQRAPYGFPAQRIRWVVEMFAKARQSSTTASTATVLNFGHQLIIPTGAWEVSYSCLTIASTSVAAAFIGAIVGLSTANNTFSDSQFITVPARVGVAVTEVDNEATKSNIPLPLSSATTYFLNISASAISGTTTLFIGDSAALTLEPTVVRAYLSYL